MSYIIFEREKSKDGLRFNGRVLKNKEAKTYLEIFENKQRLLEGIMFGKKMHGC
ncbi:MAG: hypothetical protein H0V39_02545 [Nitrosomonas sp.]|nr:hypothetical protein [Nitrosomonas sp.]